MTSVIEDHRRQATARPPAVAGTFYPADAEELARQVRGYLAAAGPGAAPAAAVVAPHAGYVYSGPVAGHAHAALAPRRGQVRRVLLLGPAHRVYVRGIAAPTVDYFLTPLGPVPVDQPALAELAALPGVVFDDVPHAPEHSLEVQLPFLQQALGEFTLVPLVVGDVAPERVADVLRVLWHGPETAAVISTDLSHYHDYETARAIDTGTARAIEQYQGELIGPEQACGFLPLRGLLAVARERGLPIRRLALANSGDTAGPRDQVVGYGAWAVG